MKRLALLMVLGWISACAPSQKSSDTTALLPVQSTSFTELDTTWTEPVRYSNAEWKQRLSPDAFYVTRQQGTERAFTSPLNDEHRTGVFFCTSCGNPLFRSQDKFDSGTGWPSFIRPMAARSVALRQDHSVGMVRDEVRCARCQAHLGHVFDDGPKPTGLRYCMNGIAMRFTPTKNLQTLRTAVFAQGCFWCLEEIFEHIRGVKAVISGYAGGQETNPTYEQVGSGSTGHAESVLVRYNPQEITYAQLLKVYFHAGDITQVNGQGPDHGRQYRSIVFYQNPAQKAEIEVYLRELRQSGVYSKPIAVEVIPETRFYPAEDYHQDYVIHHPTNPYVMQVSIPRYQRAIRHFPELLKADRKP